MVEMGWTEQQYYEQNSELGLAELGIYLSARAKANQPKGKRPAKKPPRGQSPGYKPPKRRL